MLSKFKYLIMMTIKTLQQKQVFIDQNQLVLQACIQIFYGQTSTVIKKLFFLKTHREPSLITAHIRKTKPGYTLTAGGDASLCLPAL